MRRLVYEVLRTNCEPPSLIVIDGRRPARVAGRSRKSPFSYLRRAVREARRRLKMSRRMPRKINEIQEIPWYFPIVKTQKTGSGASVMPYHFFQTRRSPRPATFRRDVRHHDGDAYDKRAEDPSARRNPRRRLPRARRRKGRPVQQRRFQAMALPVMRRLSPITPQPSPRRMSDGSRLPGSAVGIVGPSIINFVVGDNSASRPPSSSAPAPVAEQAQIGRIMDVALHDRGVDTHPPASRNALSIVHK
jgi:hypothetical protein